MAKRKRVGFSRQHLELDEIGRHHLDVETSIRTYFVFGNIRSAARFAGYTSEEIRWEMNSLLEEQDRAASMNLLAALEAAFRVDFLQRCYRRRKDPVSREFRELYALKGIYVSLEEDIFQVWKRRSSVSSIVISHLKGAFKYRHWLAHGRYWVPKFGRYDYHAIYALAEAIFDSFPFEGT